MTFDQVALEWLYQDEACVRESIDRENASDDVDAVALHRLQRRHAELQKSIERLEDKIADSFLAGRDAMQDAIRREEQPPVHVVKRQRMS